MFDDGARFLAGDAVAKRNSRFFQVPQCAPRDTSRGDTLKRMARTKLLHALLRDVVPSAHTAAWCRAYATEASSSRRFAVVGSGPAGMYAALALTKTFDGSVVDVFDRYPTPFGLVRFGVAPDHAETKLVTNKFHETLTTRDDIRFYGNVQLGRDVSVGELYDGYHGVILAYGSSGDRTLDVPGEAELEGVMSAREFVAWFNGDPEHGPESATHNAVVRALTSTPKPHVAVIGVGNVAIDCARILLRNKSELAKTDICEHALDVLRRHPVEKVSVIGRRGVAQASFSPKELREVLGLPDVRVVIDDEEFGLAPEDEADLAASRPRRRAYDVLLKAHQSPKTNASKVLNFRFKTSPLEFGGDSNGNLRSMKLGRNELVGAAGARKAISSGETETVDTAMALRSVGYRAEPIVVSVNDESTSQIVLPFDERERVVPNEYGAVLTSPDKSTAKQIPGLYVTGWLKRGPTGIIGTNLTCAEETVAKMASDFARSPPREPTASGVDAALAKRAVRVITARDWAKLDIHERALGESRGKPRVKLTSIAEMLTIV